MLFLLGLLGLLQNLVSALTLVAPTPVGASAILSFFPSPLPTRVAAFHTSPSNLTSIPTFDFRIAFSSIELHVVCSTRVDGQELADTLLSLHAYVAEYLLKSGDRPLGPKDDPFGFQRSRPPPQGVNFIAQSVQGQLMTWSVLETVAKGLYESLIQWNRPYEATFEIWDYVDGFQWGFGRVTTQPLSPISIHKPSIIPTGTGTNSAVLMANSANANVPAA